MIPKIKDLFDLNFTIAEDIFNNKEYPWEVLSEIKEFIIKLGKTLPSEKFYEISENIWIAKSAKIAKNAHIDAPCIIDENAEIRHCAFIRGSVIVGKNAVVGNSCELKNCILFDYVQVPHFNYIGDSVLGAYAHTGAGAITSNVKSDKTNVVIKSTSECIQTNRYKVGAFLGDHVEVGCNSVLNPGTVIGRYSNIYPTSCVRGVIPANSIYKSKTEITEKDV
jgi:NDP-sugar pyrophosphorylase family protein